MADNHPTSTATALGETADPAADTDAQAQAEADAAAYQARRTLLLGKLATAAGRAGTDLDHLPKRLSPSRASDFARCPQTFYFKTICGIKEPQSIATVRGRLAHYAFERIFDHPAGSRTPEIAMGYIDVGWRKMLDLNPDESEFPLGSKERQIAVDDAVEYAVLAPAGSDVEGDLLETSRQVVASWFDMERVNNFTPTGLELPDGTVVDGRELHVIAQMFGMDLHGYIDRLDRWVTPTGDVRWSVSDFKTGRYPGEGKSYSAPTMRRITLEAFFQLRVYALLCWEMLGIRVNLLRLIYVKTGSKEEGLKTLPVTEKLMNETREEIRTLWKGITRSARTGLWETRESKLCDYCYFHSVCPAKNPAAGPVDVDVPTRIAS